MSEAYCRFKSRERWMFLAFLYLALAFLLVNFLARASGLGVLVQAFNGSLIGAALFLVFNDFSERRLDRLAVLWVVVLFVFLIISELGGASRGFAVSAYASLLLGKIFVIFILMKRFSLNLIRPVFFVLAVVHLIGVIANLVHPAPFVSLMTETSFEADSSRAMGFLLNANRAAAISVILALYYWFIERRLGLFLVLVAALLLTVSRSFLVLFAVAFVYFSFIGDYSRRKIVVGILCAMPILMYLVFFGELDGTFLKIEETVYGDLKYIRAAMLVGGADLAYEFFPFGAGGGTFGSTLSKGSELYDRIGIGGWLTVIDATGIFDSGVGALLGEYGVFGFVVMFASVGLGFRLFLGKLATLGDVAFLTGVAMYLSFFRTIVADFFYSFIIVCISIMICYVRKLRLSRYENTARP